jgi:hypothetical protein
MEPGLIPVLHYVAEAKALVESDGVEKKDEHDGIFQIQDRLEEEVDPLTSSGYFHPQLEVKVTQETYWCEFWTESFSINKICKYPSPCSTLGKKPYSCFHCIKSFANLSRLQNHLQVHTRE